MKRTVEIKCVASLSAAKLFFFLGIVIAVVRFLNDVFKWMSGKSDTFCTPCTISFAIGMPILLAVIALITCFIYNRLASRFGGIKISIEE